MSRFWLFAPLLMFAAIAVAFAIGLGRDPSATPSALLNEPLPRIDLPAISDAHAPLNSEDLRGDVALLNVFASWCAPCAIEHPVLMRIAADEGAPIYGLNWKDREGAGAAWLARLGDPYRAVGDDAAGRAAIDLGVTGAPETFIIDARGRVRYRHIGPITDEFWARDLKPLVEALRAED